MNIQESAQEHRYEKSIAVLIALTTIFAAITTFLEHISSNEASRYERLAQEFSIRATTESLNGAVHFSYDWQGAFQTWRELDLMIINANEIGDFDRADQYRIIRDQLNNLSPLLQEPYFDSDQQWTNAQQYEADLYIVSSTALWEEFENKSSVANWWDQAANTFVLQLTLYAVVLSLYGLSTTLNSFIRWVFLGLGILISVANIIWAGGMLFVQPVEIPEAAIQAYASGIGFAFQGRDTEAIQAFDEALQVKPDYANALYNRGFSRLYINNYEGAAKDFEATIATGQDDTSVRWNLGWTYYLLGRFDEAIINNQIALDMDPKLIGVRTNQGLNMLALGRFANADAEFQLALDEASRQVTEARTAGAQAPTSLWYFLNAAVSDLESILSIISGTEDNWTAGPENAMILGERNEIRQFATKQIKELKEYTLSLEFFGTTPQPSKTLNATEFQFVQESYDENGEFIEYIESSVNAFGINEIGVLFDFSGFSDGQHEVWKVYVNGTEDTALRVQTSWAVGERGRAIKFITYAFSNVFVFSPGEYTIELYIDSTLVQSGNFIVLDK